MLLCALECINKSTSDTLNLLCESQTVVSLRLIKLTTGGVSAIPEALRLVPEKLDGLVDAQILVAARLMAGRPDLALSEVIALFRERVRANNQRLIPVQCITDPRE
jgi:hypothetical protein